MNFAFARCAGLAALGCCTFTSAAGAQNAGEAQPASSSLPQAVAPEPVDGAGERRIDILNYRVEGNSVLPRIEVEKAVMAFMGPQRPMSDVDAAREALEKAYRAHGYETVSVELPEQDVRGGVIRLNVVEMKVGRLRVTDARHVSPEQIKAAVPALSEGGVPNYKAVSEQLAAVNKSSNRSVTPVLRAGDTPGTVDVELNVEDSLPLHGSIELNDRSSSRTERFRLTASARYGNLFQADHSLSLQGQFAPQNPGQSWVVSGSYVAPIHGTPLTAVVYGVHSNSNVSAINNIGVIGSGNIGGIRGIYSVTSGDPMSPLVHQFTVGADYKSFKEDLNLTGSDTAKTPISYVPFTLQYSVAKRTERQELNFGISLNFGLRGVGASDTEFRLKRYEASANWAALRGDFSYLQKWPGDWRTGLRGSWQFSGRPMVSNEQFSLGGLDSVRGYYESQILGDDGASGQLQLDTPSLRKPFGDQMQDLRLFTFVDGGVMHVHKPLSGQDRNTRLISVGGGLTLRSFNMLNLSALLAAPLINRGDAPQDIGDLRGQLRLWLDF